MPRTASPLLRYHFLAGRRSLSALDLSLARMTAIRDGVGSGRRRRPTRKLSHRARAALKLQGRYMGYMRELKPKQKAEVLAAKEKKGIEAAIKRAQRLAAS